MTISVSSKAPSWLRLAPVLALGALLACSDPFNVDFPRPTEPVEAALSDLVGGAVDEPSAFDVVSGRGTGLPRPVRVDQTASWDVAFAVQNGQPVWLPRGFFPGFEDTGGIVRVQQGFDALREAPGDRSVYEQTEPVPIETGGVYVILSRLDPTVSLPCRLFAKLEVLELTTDPTRVRFRHLWNPNCDQPNLTPGEEG